MPYFARDWIAIAMGAFDTPTSTRQALRSRHLNSMLRIEYRLYRSYDTFDIGVVHSGKERQCDDLSANTLCHWKHPFLEAALAVQGKQVDRCIMKAHADVQIQHTLHECGTRHAIRQDEMKHMPIALLEISDRQFRCIFRLEFGAKAFEVVLRQRKS